ncbi:MAG: gluzincin family metallopeptidase [Dehalococcoidia bacterium]
MPDALLDELDGEAEAFAEARDREHYLNGSGQKESLDLAAIYARHARLFARDTVAQLDRSDRTDERYPELRRLAVEGYLEAAANELTEQISDCETRDTVEWDGALMPYRSVAPMVRNEPDRQRRHALERRLVEATAVRNPLRERRWDILYAQARDLGYASYRALAEDVGRIAIAGLAAIVGRFLRETERPYRRQLGAYLQEIGLDPAHAEKSDLAFLFRQPRFDRYFAAESLVDVYTRTIAGLGLTGEAQRRITLDVERRPTKSPRAFCSPVRIPDEVYLVISPQGGQYDYETMLHEGGHAEHFAHADARLPFALRGLGDDSVTEGFAFVLEHIVAMPPWLARELSFDESTEYLRMRRFNRLYMLRRYAAKLLYEAELHASPNVRGRQKRYADLLTAATGVRYAPEDYLFDVDDAFYCARYLRAWIFDAQLRGMLCERFGADWFGEPAAGAKLIDLWSHGQRYDAPGILAREGLGGLDIAPLQRELTQPQ